MKQSRIILLLLAWLAASTGRADADKLFWVKNASDGLADNSSQTIVCTKTGRMIISTLGNVNFYDGSSFSYVPTDSRYEYPLPMADGGSDCLFDAHHQMWLKDGHSVTCLSLMSERFITNVDSIFRSYGVKSPVLDMFVDNSKVLWMLTDSALVREGDHFAFAPLHERHLQDVYSLGDTLLCFYDNGECVGVNQKSGNTILRSKAYSWDFGRDYAQSSRILWLAGSIYQVRGGADAACLLRFDVKQGTWRTLFTTDYRMNSITEERGRLYIACDRGYLEVDTATASYTLHDRLHLQTGLVLTPKCNTLAFDLQGGMWIATDRRGLLYARPNIIPFRTLPIESPEAQRICALMHGIEANLEEFNGQKANCMLNDSRNWSWFGTTTGLKLYRSPKDPPVEFTKRQGLYNNVIHSIVEDRDHNIWVATSYGISCVLFDGDKVHFVNSFAAEDNVPNASFVDGHAILLDDGSIAMEALDCVVLFDPASLADVNEPHPVVMYPKLIKLLVNGEFVQPAPGDEDAIIDRAITRVRDIYVSSEYSSISLTFSGLNYYRPLQTFYRVRILGHDNEWHQYSYHDGTGLVDTKGMLHLPLLSLKPGDYEVQIQASMFPGLWREPTYRWYIHVTQPWWQAKAVYVIIGIVLLLLAIVNSILFNRNTRMRVRRNNEEGDMVRKVNNFVERYHEVAASPLRSRHDESYGNATNKRTALDPEFIRIMEKIVPYVEQRRGRAFSMHDLSRVAGMNVVDLYEVVKANLYKDPYDFVRLVRLRQAADLLVSTDQSFSEIARTCGFSSTNYFIGSFFHQYKVTPREYRQEA